jgi:hypothetical protein
MAIDDEPTIVQVVYARPDEQPIVEVDFEPGMTAADAVERSGLVDDLSVLSEQGLVLGVWGVEVSTEHRLNAGDRVEVSRPLQADPRVMRREFMSDGRVMGGAPAPDAKLKKKAGR